MKIAESNIAMFGSRTYTEKYEKSESLKMWVGPRRPDFEGRGSPGATAASPPAGPADYILELSGGPPVAETAPQQKTEVNLEARLSEEDKVKIKLIEKFIEVLTGKKVKLKIASGEIKDTARELKDTAGDMDKLRKQMCMRENAQTQPPAERSQGWGLEYDYREMQYEREQTVFSAEGVIKTADGQEIGFTVDLAMSREFLHELNISVRAGDAKKIDPLVINFGGTAAQLTTTRFSFDLDSDGQEEQVAFVSPGSGFLALDRNNDGVINNGRELFGPSGGNGFAELSAYDEDGNGWIDENDPVFSKLRIWSRDAQGNNTLVALGQQGIGAVYLGHIATPFSLHDQNNNLQGQVVTSGIFVREDGTVGTVQQIDLAV